MLIGTLCWASTKSRSGNPGLRVKKRPGLPVLHHHTRAAGIGGTFFSGTVRRGDGEPFFGFQQPGRGLRGEYYRVWNPQSNDRQRLTVGNCRGRLWLPLRGDCDRPGADQRQRAFALVHGIGHCFSRLGGTFSAGVSAPRAGTQAAQIAIAACLLFTAWATLFPREFRLHGYMIGVGGHLIVLIGGALASLFFPNRDAASRNLTLQGWLRTAKQPVS